MEENPSKILQKMGVMISLDDPRTPEEILSAINRSRIEINIITEPDPEKAAAMGVFALKHYPLTSDSIDL